MEVLSFFKRKLGTDLAHDVGNRISSTAIERRLLQSQQRRFLVPRRSRKRSPIRSRASSISAAKDSGLFRSCEMSLPKSLILSRLQTNATKRPSIIKTLVERVEEISHSNTRRYRGKKVLKDNNCPLRFVARKSSGPFRRVSGLSDYPGMSDELINCTFR